MEATTTPIRADRPLKVFISSTSQDLSNYRRRVIETIAMQTGWTCVCMERFGAHDASPSELVAGLVEKSDVLVGIVGHFRGSCPPSEERSFTELEYEAAVNARIPRLVFLARDDFPVPADKIESDAKRSQQQEFRTKLKKGLICDTFEADPLDLANRVLTALRNWECQNEYSEPPAKPRQPKPDRKQTAPKTVAMPLKTVIMAESHLMVIKAVTIAWGLDALLLEKEYRLIQKPLEWSDAILRAIDDGQVGIGIYNYYRTLEYLDKHHFSNVVVPLPVFFASMRGKNFYVLALNGGRWKDGMTLEDFRASLLSKGGTIAVPRESDMLDNLLLVLSTSREDLSRYGVCILEIDSADGLSHFSHNQDMLMIHGQNIRFQARYRTLFHDAEFCEPINYDSVGQDLQEALRGRSRNCVVCHKRLSEEFGRDELLKIFRAAYANFRGAWSDPEVSPRLLGELGTIPFRYGTRDPSEAHYVAREIVWTTYG